MYNAKPYKITEIQTFTPDVKLFKINAKLNPKPGQFMEVSIPGIGECPLASCSFNNNEIDLLTREAGNVTSAIFNLKKNESLFVRGPYGKGFPIEKLKGKNLILVAGGTGLAPITSLIEYIEQNRKDFGDIQIYFGFRNDKHILLRDKINKWSKKFKIVVTLDEKCKDPLCKFGLIHEIMDKYPPTSENSVALLCGPEQMMKSVTKKLNSFKITDDRIYWSLERRMECAFGNCGRCLIQDVYVCKDGPVFRYDFIKPRIENEEYSNKIKTN